MIRDAKQARKLLENLARRLEHNHPGAAASLREGLDETHYRNAPGSAAEF